MSTLIKDTLADKLFLLVGNKEDMDREVPFKTASSFDEENGMPYFETSVVTKESIIEAFTLLVEKSLIKFVTKRIA